MPSIQEVRQKYPQYSDMSDQQLSDALHAKFYNDMPREQFDAKVGGKPTDVVDETTGAPASVRAAVGSVPEQISPGAGPDLRLQAIRKTFPDAQPTGDGNFTYTNPKTGKKTLYNPKGLDTGDLASILPQIGEFAGGTIGAIGGGILGIPGGPPGIVGGASVGGGAGATIGKEAVERGALALQGIPDTRSLPEQALNALPTFALNAGGEGVGSSLGATPAAITRGLARGKGGIGEVQRATSDLERFGATPSVAQATQNAAMDSIESLTAKIPGGAGVIREAARKQSETVAAGVAAKLKAMAGTAPDVLAAGNAAIEGVTNFARNFSDRAGVLYDKLSSFIPSGQEITAQNTRAALDLLAPPNASGLGKPLINSTLAKMRDGLIADTKGGVGVPYAELAANRSMVGRKLGTPQLVDDVPRAQLKQVYAAMTDDLRIAAQEQGPDALKAFERANAYYKAGIERIDKMLDPIIKNKLPEQAFAAVEASAKQGPTRIQALRKSVSPEQWQVIAGTVADKLGKAKPGFQGTDADVFSFDNFLANWQKLPDTSKDALFSGPNMGGIRGDLDALTRASQRIKDSSKAFANPSGTAGAQTGNAMIFGAIGGLLTGAPGLVETIGAAIGAAHVGARLMTSPTFVHWLALSTRVNPNGVGAHLGRLSAIALNSDADTRDAIASVLDNIQTQNVMTFTPPGGTVH